MHAIESQPGSAALAAKSTDHNPHGGPGLPLADPGPDLPLQWQEPLAQDELLRQYIDHRGNLCEFSLSRGITIDQLDAWLQSERIVARINRLVDMSDRRSALIARLARPDALEALAQVVVSRDATPSQRRLAASTLVRVAERFTKESEPSAPRRRGRRRDSAAAVPPPGRQDPASNPAIDAGRQADILTETPAETHRGEPNPWTSRNSSILPESSPSPTESRMETSSGSRTSIPETPAA
jgi:hypothetical protein